MGCFLFLPSPPYACDLVPWIGLVAFVHDKIPIQELLPIRVCPIGNDGVALRVSLLAALPLAQGHIAQEALLLWRVKMSMDARGSWWSVAAAIHA